MKQISIQDLKATLSATIAEVERGEVVIVTRHNEPVARLTAATPAHLQRAANAASGLKSVLKRATKGRYLDLLQDDRKSR